MLIRVLFIDVCASEILYTVIINCWRSHSGNQHHLRPFTSRTKFVTYPQGRIQLKFNTQVGYIPEASVILFSVPFCYRLSPPTNNQRFPNLSEEMVHHQGCDASTLGQFRLLRQSPAGNDSLTYSNLSTECSQPHEQTQPHFIRSTTCGCSATCIHTILCVYECKHPRGLGR